MLHRVFRLFLLPSALLLGILGCGGSGNVPVSGKLNVNGKLVKPETGTNIAINFHAKAGSAFGTAQLAESGDYTVSSGGKPGLPPGDYIVTVTISKPSNPKDPYSLPKSVINTDYGDKSLAKIQMSVKSAAPAGSYDINIGK